MSDSPRFQSAAEQLTNRLGYESAQYVACGAFKETYKAMAPNGVRVALKIMDPAKCSRSRTDRELDSMKRSDHKCIARLIDHGELRVTSGEKYLYTIEDFFDGGSLGDRLNGGLLKTGVTMSYGNHLAQAISHLATLDLVHRDIKPDNIMFDADSHCPVLVDFGLVRDLSKSSLTQAWHPQGPCTPLFAAPEQLNNEKSMIDWRTDQFALGLVIAACLTGKHPFAPVDSVNNVEAIDAVGRWQRCLPWYEEFARKHGIDFALKMLEPWPNRRFTAPDEMVQAFLASEERP